MIPASKVRARRSLTRRCGVLLAAALLGMAARATPAWAGNYDGVLIGNEAAMTGGAVTSIVSTGAALWYNPAGLANLDEDRLDLGGTGFNVRLVSGDGPIANTAGQAGEQQVFDTAFIPSALALSLNVGPRARPRRLGVGVFATLHQDIFSRTNLVVPNGTSTTDATLAVNGTATIYHVPVTYAVRVNETLSLGVAVHLVVSTERYSERETLLETVDGTGQVLSFWESSFSASSLAFGVRASAGLQWQATKHLRLGASLLTPSRMFLTKSFSDTLQTGPSGTMQIGSATHDDELEFHFSRFEPLRMRVGGAYQWTRGWLSLEGDVSGGRRNEVLGRDAGVVLNARIGYLHRLSGHLMLGGGLFTDRQNYQGPYVPSERRVDFYGGTVGVRYSSDGFRTGRNLEYSLTLAPRYAYGSGRQGVWLVNTDTPASDAGITDRPLVVHELGIHFGAELAWK